MVTYRSGKGLRWRVGPITVAVMSRPLPFEARERAVVGRATTRGQALPLGVDDPVVAARAVRRALADARLRALDVEVVTVVAPPPLTRLAVEGFMRRALGPHAAGVELLFVEADVPDAAGLTDHALGALAPEHGRRGIAVTVGIAGDGTTVALCLGPGDRRP